MKELFERLEAAVLRRNPAMAERLRPGLTEYRIANLLEEANIHGAVGPIIALFSWKNGTLPHVDPTEERPYLFPATNYMLPDLNSMMQDFRRFKELAMFHSRVAEFNSQYFPLFWNGATNFMAVDLNPKGINKIVVIEQRSPKPLRDAYPTFKEFLQDAIVANENDEPLACFRPKRLTLFGRTPPSSTP